MDIPARSLIRSFAASVADQIALATMFTESAKSVVLKMKETAPCAVAVRRIRFDVMPTSDTWAVIPITNEK